MTGIGLDVGEEEQKFTYHPEGGVIVTELIFESPMLAVQFLQRPSFLNVMQSDTKQCRAADRRSDGRIVSAAQTFLFDI
jgi:hypothetical protein